MDEFNYHSVRAKKARLGKVLNHPLARFLMWLFFVLGVIGFAYLMFITKRAEAWLCLPVSMLSLAILLWSKSDLFRIPLGKGNSINDILSANVINALGKNPTPNKFVKNFVRLPLDSFESRAVFYILIH